MSVRLAKRREGIVSLTHTEIMLVLATVILLLLLAKDIDLSQAETNLATARDEKSEVESELAKAQEEIAALREQEGESAGEAAARKAKVDSADEVRSVLVRGGFVDEGAGPERLGPAVSILAENNQRADELDAAVDEALSRSGTEAKSGKADGSEESAAHARNEQIKKMGEAAAVGKAAREALGENTTDAESVEARIVELKKAEREAAELRNRQSAGKDRQSRDLKEKIGCLPCWLGDGKRRYYFAYDLTYHADSNSFGIKPSNDWKAGAKVVDDALTGGLSVLKDYPRGLMTSAELLEFGRRIDKGKDRLHGDECLLAATINKNRVDGNVIEFIRDEVGFCPIWRKAQ